MRYADRQLEILALRPSPLGDDPDVEEARASLLERAARKQPGPKMAAVRDFEIEGLPARLYLPRPEPSHLVLHLRSRRSTWPASVDDAVAAMRWIANGPKELGSLGPSARRSEPARRHQSHGDAASPDRQRRPPRRLPEIASGATRRSPPRSLNRYRCSKICSK